MSNSGYVTGDGNIRLSRDNLFIQVAQLFARRGTCMRSQVGAIAVIQGRIISSGYVGAPPGMPHCLDVGCITNHGGGCIRTIHAEANVIAFAARSGIALKRSTIYATHSPCLPCAQLLISAGIDSLVYNETYRDESGISLLREAGVVIGILGDRPE